MKPNTRQRAQRTEPPRSSTRLRVLVPEADNNGIPFPPEDYARFEAFGLDTAGGITERGRARGLWQDNGKTYVDTHREYDIIVPRHRARQVTGAIVEYVRKAFRQRAVYVEMTPVQVAGF